MIATTTIKIPVPMSSDIIFQVPAFLENYLIRILMRRLEKDSLKQCDSSSRMEPDIQSSPVRLFFHVHQLMVVIF